MNYELISAVIVYSIVFLIIYKKRDKFQIMDKIFFVYKWDKGVDFIKKFANKHLIIFYTIGIPVCLFFMVFSIKIMIDGALMILSSPNPEPTVALAIPGVRIPGSPIYIPFWYGIIALATVVFFHELSHGISATIEKIKLKSTGIGMLLILPLAFVEPEQKSYEKSKKMTKIRMLIAGSFANICIAFLAILIINFGIFPLINSIVDYDGVIISSALENEPAFLAGVENNSRIISINNESISDMDDFYSALFAINPGEAVLLQTNVSSYELNASANPNNESLAYLGVMVFQDWKFKELGVPHFILSIPLILSSLLMWISNLNFAIGLINLFPLWITDGGKVVLELLSSLFKDNKKAMAAANYLFTFCLVLLLFNFLGAYIINGLNFIGLL